MKTYWPYAPAPSYVLPPSPSSGCRRSPGVFRPRSRPRRGLHLGARRGLHLGARRGLHPGARRGLHLGARRGLHLGARRGLHLARVAGSIWRASRTPSGALERRLQAKDHREERPYSARFAPGDDGAVVVRVRSRCVLIEKDRTRRCSWGAERGLRTLNVNAQRSDAGWVPSEVASTGGRSRAGRVECWVWRSFSRRWFAVPRASGPRPAAAQRACVRSPRCSSEHAGGTRPEHARGRRGHACAGTRGNARLGRAGERARQQAPENARRERCRRCIGRLQYDAP